MKIVNIIGGLGNQLFQYAFALILKTKYADEEVKIDLHHFNHYPLHNGYELDQIFKCDLPVATSTDIRSLSYYIPNYKLSRIARRLLPRKSTEFIETTFGKYDAAVLEFNGDCYFEGYWQAAQYFNEYRNTVLDAYQFKPFDRQINLQCAEDMMNTNSVAVHVRRGDYLKDPTYGNICTIEYYQKAFEYTIKNLHNANFYIFSNDIEWCQQKFQSLLSGHKITYINWNTGRESYRDIQLMTYAKYLIVANSSFSWWGSFLNNREDKTVIAPHKWINKEEASDIQDRSWLLI